ncbi:MAG: hypothetical protein RLZZ324_78 [Candidatus Parcubacteria bacterium]|jgi:excinuclease ABC subunit C
MAIPDSVVIKDNELPPRPGVYFMKDAVGRLLYIGKATSLRTRVGSYFTRPHDARIAMMVSKIRRIDYEETPTAIEALMLEASLIKKHQPPYNVDEKDDKSFVHLAFTREPFPKPVMIRGHELARAPKKQFLKTFGPFRSAYAVRAALDALRRTFPWTTCQPNRGRPCFYRHLGQCPGVCTGEITSAEYKKIIRELMRFFSGDRTGVVRALRAEMKRAAAARKYEDAAEIRDRLFALDHVHDVAVMKEEGSAGLGAPIDIFGRIEGYDISNTGGQDSVASMVVFHDGEPRKSEYRKFTIKTVVGADDPASIHEVLRRRFAHDGEGWRMPDLILVDGGATQVAAAKRAMGESGVKIPLVGMVKGPDRKGDDLVFDKDDYELQRLVNAFKPLLRQVRDEAHRFAIGFHRSRRAKRFLPKR